MPASLPVGIVEFNWTPFSMQWLLSMNLAQCQEQISGSLLVFAPGWRAVREPQSPPALMEGVWACYCHLGPTYCGCRAVW